ncbi:leucine-rich repeat protein [Blautia sp.]|uniref:leucine-rich repeat protein n=1 Tax=Blautia sp. TaxID=1955243 RepID=UPI003FD8F989
MKKTKDFCLRLMCCFLFLGLFCGTEVFAAVQEGKPGETFSGKYAVIINTDTTNPGNTGTLQFDGTSAQAADSEAEDYAVVQGGSNASAQAATEGTAGEAADVGQVQSLEDDQLQAYMQDDQPMLTAVQAAATTYQVGEKKYIYRTNGHDTYGKTYVCIGVGEHCYVWMDETLKADYDTAGKTALIAADMAAVYDGQPYRILNQLCAGDFPAQDGSGKLSILLESLSSASGMYMYDEGITAIHINTPSASSYVSGEMSKRNGLLVHEGQHAILWLKTGFMSTGRYSWLNEGLAVAVMDYLWGGTDSSGWLNGIGSNTAIRSGASLIYENYRDDNAQDYGMPYLFVRYVIDRMAGSYQPMKVLLKFYTIDASSLSCEQYLEKVTGVSFKDLMADFYTAVAAGESSGKYSFYGDTIAAAKAATFPVYAGDSNENHTLPAASAILVKLSNGKFTVPTDGSAGIVYRIIGSRNSSLAPAEGDGTSANPYKISSIDDLNLIQANQGAYYRLTKNISTDGRTNFSASYFSGTLDGAGFTITGLQKPLIQQNAGTIKDLNIVADFDYDSHDIHGVVAQYNTGKIQDCKVTGTVTGHMGSTSSMSHPAFGGIVGENEVAGTISGCSSGVNISISMTATDSYVGGIAGVNIGTIEKCVAGGNLSVTQANGNSYQVYLGGIAGRIEQFGNMGGYVKQCAFTGTLHVTGGTAVTGQICAQVNANVLNSAIGLNGHVSDCYGKNGQGALIGTNTEQTLTTGGVLTAEQMKNPNSYKGWSFDGDWQISKDGLPERADASAIRSLSVSGVPTKCYVGEVPAYWGTLIVNNSTSVTITKDMITGFENSEMGTRELTINYKGKQTSWSMTVEKPSASDITSIVLSGCPKTTYSENQKFDPSGASFFATIGGRYVYIYSGFSYDKTGPLKSADTSVIFNYFGKEISVSITVTARKATKLSVLAAPAKTQFTVGNTLDLSGVKLQITYNDGTQTPIFKADELEKYGVHVAFGKNGSFTTVAADKVLESDDSGSTIVFYATDKLPSEYGSVVVASSTITVRSPLTVPALDLYVSAGKSAAQYPCTDNVTGGSGTYATTVIEEKLPAGLTRTNLPGEKYNAFGYTGVVTASAGDYSSQYKISDTETQESIQVTVTIHVVPSDQAAFYSFVLKKVENPGLKQDVIGAIGEDTIVLRVPRGTNITELKPSIDYGSGMGTELPSGFWNGSKHDFTSPVVYTLTAPDGVTKKSYTVSVEFYDDTSEEVQSGDEILSPADNTKISCKDSEEVILKGWAGDSSKEISLFKYVVNGISYTASANATTQTIPNARAYEVKISGSSLKEGNNTLEIWVMYADNSGTGSGGTLKKLGTRTVVKEGHKEVKDTAVAATCETAGKTEGSHCSVCNTVIKAQTTTAALGHSWDSGKVTKAATCTTAGTKTYTCTRCKKTRTETIAATGHKEVKDAAVAATCETAGKTEGSHCSVCNTVIKAQTTTAALGHDYGEWKTIKAATYTEPGQAERVCRRNASHKEYRQLPILEKAKIALSACSIQLSEQTYVYDGIEKTPTVTITYNKKTLTEGKDYQVYLADNVNPGTAKITVIAKTDSDYTGTATITFEIRKALPENATVIEPGAFSNCTNLVNLNIKENVTEIGDNAFADSKNLQNIYFYGNSPKLGNNIFKNVTATVYYPYTDKTWSLDILRDYGGNITWVPWNPKTGSPAKRSLALCDIRIAEQKYTYDGTEKTPEMIIMDGNYTLQKNTDYTVKCSNNVNAGNAELEITGAGNYSGTYKAGFLIEQTEPSLKFDKKTITVKYGTKPFLCALSEKTTDGTITYSSSNPKAAVVDPASGKVTIKGGGTAAIMAYAAKGTNYTAGSTFCTIKVTKRSNTIKASNIRRTWYAKARKISINAKVYGKAPLKYSSSSKSVKVDKKGRITIAAKFTGSARITIRSSATAGYNAATKSITVTVNPAGTTLMTAKNLSGRKAQITWKKNRYVTGYEIQYSVNKNFRSGSKKTVSGVSKTKYTLTKLQKNKTYYVRIRTYKKSGTKKYYSSWSKVKAVRIRK